MKKSKQTIALLAVLLACALPVNTQADIGVPVPDKKPLFLQLASIPLPMKKPNQNGVIQAAVTVDVNGDIPTPPKKPLVISDQDNEGSDNHEKYVHRVKETTNPIDPISKQQADIYSRIFAFQAHGEIQKADLELRNLKDERLLGHVLFQRYMHPTAYKTSFDELKYWLDMYADHPGADRIYKLALAKKPSDFNGKIREPQKFKPLRIVREPTVERAKYYQSTVKRSASQRSSVRSLKQVITKNIRSGSPTHALKQLKTNSAASFLDSVEKDKIKGEIAAGYFYAGQNSKALEMATAAVKRSGDKVPFAAWIAGLANWNLGKYEKAAQFFAITATSEYASGWNKSAAAFWAARSHMRTANVKEVSKWLNISYEHPHTFYGLLAGRALGHDHEFSWKMPPFTKKYFKILNNDPKGRRAMALAAAGQPHLAEVELAYIDAENNKELYTALLSYAGFADLPALAYRLGGVLSEKNADGELFNAALYPKSPWKPTNGYEVDSALINAIMRQESRFNPLAENSYSGASGLMQLMPATASYISRKDYTGAARHKLKNPQLNLDIGQKYLKHLLKNPLVKGDVIKLLVAYNAGPGNLQKWQRQMDKDIDPLMFIEMIPVKETRDYVEHVLSNYWIYRMREGKQTNTLDVLAQGQWPTYLELQKLEEYEVALSP